MTTTAPEGLDLRAFEDFMQKPINIADSDYEELGKRLSNALKGHFSKVHTPYRRKKNTLYASEVGAPCLRKLWYKAHDVPKDKPLSTSDILKFSIGFMMEELLLFLMQQAGYTVEGEQELIIYDKDMPTGWCVRGRQDAIINGHPVDVKTASKYGMKKFKNEDALMADDAFGYIPQLGIYSYDKATDTYSDGYFLVANKETGAITLMSVASDSMRNMMPDLRDTVKAIESPVEPDRIEDSTSKTKYGEDSLCFNCGYCDYKQTCFKADGGVRSFRYATGRELHLVNPTKIPRLEEIT